MMLSAAKLRLPPERSTSFAKSIGYELGRELWYWPCEEKLAATLTAHPHPILVFSASVLIRTARSRE